jgi:hypothetical protein
LKEDGTVPIAKVRKPKPRMTPTYPRIGSIHMAIGNYKVCSWFKET